MAWSGNRLVYPIFSETENWGPFLSLVRTLDSMHLCTFITCKSNTWLMPRMEWINGPWILRRFSITRLRLPHTRDLYLAVMPLSLNSSYGTLLWRQCAGGNKMWRCLKNSGRKPCRQFPIVLWICRRDYHSSILCLGYTKHRLGWPAWGGTWLHLY